GPGTCIWTSFRAAPRLDGIRPSCWPTSTRGRAAMPYRRSPPACSGPGTSSSVSGGGSPRSAGVRRMVDSAALASSFRDPSGFVFLRGERVLRQVNVRYRDDYDRLLDSGLYKELVDARLLVAHREVD